MQNSDPVTGEVIGVEGENAFDPVHIHGRDQPRVMNFCAKHAMLDDQALPFRADRGRVGSSIRMGSIFSTSPSASETGKPRPLLTIGRVTTFQHSEMFCDVKQTFSPAASNRATLSIAIA
jgi:hypothetical protein